MNKLMFMAEVEAKEIEREYHNPNNRDGDSEMLGLTIEFWKKCRKGTLSCNREMPLRADIVEILYHIMNPARYKGDSTAFYYFDSVPI